MGSSHVEDRRAALVQYDAGIRTLNISRSAAVVLSCLFLQVALCFRLGSASM